MRDSQPVSRTGYGNRKLRDQLCKALRVELDAVACQRARDHLTNRCTQILLADIVVAAEAEWRRARVAAVLPQRCIRFDRGHRGCCELDPLSIGQLFGGPVEEPKSEPRVRT